MSTSSNFCDYVNFVVGAVMTETCQCLAWWHRHSSKLGRNVCAHNGSYAICMIDASIYCHLTTLNEHWWKRWRPLPLQMMCQRRSSFGKIWKIQRLGFPVVQWPLLSGQCPDGGTAWCFCMGMSTSSNFYEYVTYVVGAVMKGRANWAVYNSIDSMFFSTAGWVF